MRKAVFSYAIEIIDEPFQEEGIAYPRTVKVVSVSEDGRMYGTNSYGYLEKKEIYKWIQQGKDVCLDHAYVKNFSIAEYKSLHHIAQHDVVVLNNFSANRAFFDAEDEICFNYSSFQGESAMFNQVVFGGSKLSFYHSTFANKKVDFSDSLFYVHEVNFRFVEFENAQVSFKKASFFGEEISFINSRFNGPKTDFSSIEFNESNVRFQFTKFKSSDLSFEKSRFRGEIVDFGKAEFPLGKADFRLCDFGNASVSFDECIFGKGRIRFRKAKFGEGNVSFELSEFENCELSFEHAEFGLGKLSFYQSIGEALNFRFCHLNGYLDLRLDSCQRIDLSNAIVRDVVDFKPSRKTTVQIGEVNFSEIRNLGKLFLDWDRNNVIQLITNQQETTLHEKANQLRMLKEEFGIQGLYEDEDKAYLAFRRHEMKYKTEEALKRNRLNALWVYPRNLIKIIVFDKMGHYATNPARVLTSMLLSYLLFTLIYILIALNTSSSIESSIGEPEKLSLISKSFYHSAVTYLTIGYGDYYPSGIIRWVSGLEGFVGLFLMAYFTVAFVRKILR